MGIPSFSLAGKVAIVTGGKRGIGRVLVQTGVADAVFLMITAYPNISQAAHP